MVNFSLLLCYTVLLSKFTIILYYYFLSLLYFQDRNSESKMSLTTNDVIQKAEDFADTVLRQSKHILPHLARFCLIATFFEDGIRMWYQWVEQREYIDHQWGCGWYIASLFCLINLVGQLSGCIMVLGRIKVEVAVGIMFSIIGIQVSTQINSGITRVIRCHAHMGGSS